MRYIFFVFMMCTKMSFAQDWKWAGFEVIGYHKLAKAELLKFIPIKIGDLYKEDPISWEKWCANIKTHFKAHFTKCSSVRYIDFKSFFILEIVESGYEYRIQFRAEPKEDIPLANLEIMDLYERLYKRLWELFNKGIGVQELTDKGYLDYADKEMHDIIEKLIQLTPKYSDNLLEVLKKDKDVNKREKAANLLNWTVTNLADSVVKANSLLDDSSELVRNNISRFTLHFLEKVQSQTDRQGIIDHLLIQLDRPSHGDRNKAIYNLIQLAEKFPSDRSYIKVKGFPLIEYTAKTSILDNVSGPATQLIKLLNGG